MLRSYYLMRQLSPDAFPGGGIDNPLDEEDETPAGTGGTTPATTTETTTPPPAPTTPATGGQPGPALGALATQDNLTPEQIRAAGEGKTPPEQKTPPATTPEATTYAGFANPNDFAEKVLGLQKGLVTWDDNTTSNFSELSAEEQQGVIEDWQAALPTREDRQLLSAIKAVGGIEAYARQVASTSSPAALSDDQVTESFLKRDYPKATPEQLAQALAHAKTNPLYADQVANQRAALQNQEQQQAQRQAEESNQLYVETARALPAVLNVKLNDEHRNEMLADILTPDDIDPTATRFTKLFDDPKNMLELNWMWRYGRPLLQQAMANGFLKAPAGGGGGSGGGGNGGQGQGGGGERRRARIEDPMAE